MSLTWLLNHVRDIFYILNFLSIIRHCCQSGVSFYGFNAKHKINDVAYPYKSQYDTRDQNICPHHHEKSKPHK